MNPVITRSYHVPARLVCRQGCPSHMTPFYQTSEIPADDRRELVHQYTTMRLVHLAKNNVIKDTFPLQPIHATLETASLVLSSSGSANILLSMVSFECLIKTASEQELRVHICFGLRIPGANTSRENVFSYDMLEKLYGDKKDLYRALGHFYRKGRSVVNPRNCKHGHAPDYDSTSSKHDQYIRHTEQLLVAYLALPTAAQGLSEQLRGRIRAKYDNASTVKVYNMALHMHSTKVCCAPCEYSLLGLMNERDGFMQGTKRLGLLPNLEQALVGRSETLPMSLPRNSSFQLLVTVSASQPDADHQKQPTYTQVVLGNKSTPFYNVFVKGHAVSRYIFTTMVNTAYDQRRVPFDPNLNDFTVVISGSQQTPGSQRTMDKAKSVRGLA